MPNGMMVGVVIPVIKSKSKSANDCQNYRPVSLSTIMSKILEKDLSV